jgi:DNA polymerase-3 subunit alpha
MTFELFVQTSYSFNGSLLDVDPWIARAKEYGYTALGIADEHNLYAAIKFYQGCLDAGIKPILGSVLGVQTIHGGKTTFLFIAKTNLGYRNLLKLVSVANTAGPEIPWENVMEWKDGLAVIALPDRGDLSAAILANDLSLAADLFRQYRRTFETFYLGIDLSDFVSEMRIAPIFRTLGECVIVHRVHYLDKDDLLASKVLSMILKDEKVTEEGMFVTEEALHDFKTPAELTALYAEDGEAIRTTERLIESVHVTIDFDRTCLPKYPVPENRKSADYLRALATKGLEKRLSVKETQKYPWEQYRERLDYELSVIESMGFCDYFLIVWDFVLYAKKHGILVGPGRGSAAGSLVSFSLGITDIDPLEHRLYFERFLNPERITMPDIDTDFPDDRRDDVIRYVVEKYGKDHVSNIIAFGTFQGKSAIRDTGRILHVSDNVINEITGYVSEADNSIEEFKKNHPEKYRFLMESPDTARLLQVSERIAGLPRHVSTHAAGIVITDQPLTEYSPVQNGLMGMYQTQYEAIDLERIGLLKIDFLGIRNLTTIDRVLRLIEAKTGEKINIYRLPLKDEPTFRLLRDVHTLGIFQLESEGMMNLLRKLQVRSFEDIAVAVALFRPGPMENIPTYLRRRNGEETVVYPHPDLEKILKDTHGIIVYQEQIMQIAHDFAGFTLGEADVLRRAVSKKKEEVLQQERQRFVTKCVGKGYSQTVANEIYDYIVKFANYGFNKNHSVVYALVAYWMAYLKAHYPTYFMGVLLDSAIGSAAATADYIRECRKMNIKVLPPRINESQPHFVMENGNLRYPYLGIRNIGAVAAETIQQIKGDKPFTGFLDFLGRAQGLLNSRAIESLILVGMFDDFGQTKKTLMKNLKSASQFMALGGYSGKETFVFLEEPEFEFEELARQEKELIGLNLSYHAFLRYEKALEAKGIPSVSVVLQQPNGPTVFGGLLQKMKKIQTKQGDEMAFLTFEDAYASLEAILFPKDFRFFGPGLQLGEIYVVRGTLEDRDKKRQVLVTNLVSWK